MVYLRTGHLSSQKQMRGYLRSRFAVFFILFHCQLAVGSSAAGEFGPDKTSRRDVFLITIDTLRANHVPCYGYDRAQTPSLDPLANRRCQGCARSVPDDTPPPLFFVSVDFKGVSVSISHLFSTLRRGFTSVDSKALRLHQNCASPRADGGERGTAGSLEVRGRIYPEHTVP